MRHQFPMPPGDNQYPFEPERTCGKIANRAGRIKALGNAVVPQVAYPIFEHVYRVLEVHS